MNTRKLDLYQSVEQAEFKSGLTRSARPFALIEKCNEVQDCCSLQFPDLEKRNFQFSENMVDIGLIT